MRLRATLGHPWRPLPCGWNCSHGQICRRERWEPGAAFTSRLELVQIIRSTVPARHESDADCCARPYLISYSLAPTLTFTPISSDSYSHPFSLPLTLTLLLSSPLLSLHEMLQTCLTAKLVQNESICPQNAWIAVACKILASCHHNSTCLAKLDATCQTR